MLTWPISHSTTSCLRPENMDQPQFIAGATRAVRSGPKTSPPTTRSDLLGRLSRVMDIYLKNSLTWNGSAATLDRGTGIPLASSPFVSVAGGRHYLEPSSCFRGTGSSSIDPQLLADLRQRTVDAPTLHANENFTSSQPFGSTASVDVGPGISCGYHYPVIDHIFQNCTATAPLSFAAGVSAAWITPQTQQGVPAALVVSGTTISFNGTERAHNHWMRADAVQESSVSTPAWLAEGLVVTGPDSSHAGTAAAQFTIFSKHGTAGFGLHVRTDGYSSVSLTHCEAYGGSFGQGMTAGTKLFSAVNCLFDACSISAGAAQPGVFAMRNCTLHSGQMLLIGSGYTPGQWSATVRDSAFDSIAFSLLPPYQNGQPNWSPFTLDHNAFSGAHPSYPDPGNTDHSNVTFDWQTGFFGGFYLPSSSTLINAGSRPASDAGLFYYTTQQSQAREDHSLVDIGFHRPADSTTTIFQMTGKSPAG